MFTQLQCAVSVCTVKLVYGVGGGTRQALIAL